MKTISCRVNPIFFVMFFRTIKIHHHELQRENQQLKKATTELQKEIQTLSQSKTTLKEAVSEDDKALLQNEIQVLQKELSQWRAALWWRMWSPSILEFAEDNKRAQKKGGKCSGKKKAMEEVNGRVVYSSSRLSKVEKFFTWDWKLFWEPKAIVVLRKKVLFSRLNQED